MAEAIDDEPLELTPDMETDAVRSFGSSRLLAISAATPTMLHDLLKRRWMLGNRGYDADWSGMRFRPRASPYEFWGEDRA